MFCKNTENYHLTVSVKKAVCSVFVLTSKYIFLLFSCKDISRMLMLKLLSELEVAGENEVLSGADVRNDVVRQLPFSQRERKTGCRNFFWKTFTSC
uniref:Somatostatin/Cortistatin C-terminal domain-containing protein n=1 Tax=Astyanax mexicanus TaxID=7994 RepID=A0A8B9GWH4_ASTMX